jgi:predicted metal-dependent enzyme (double-stranded beta helix superfamily)
MDHLRGAQARMDYIRNSLPGLLADESPFVYILERMARAKRYPDLSKPTLFDNEVLLYLDRSRRFSLRLFLFGPKEYTPVHDHSAWGVIGTLFAPLDIVKYERLDDGALPGIARLDEPRHRILRPGETDLTLPLDEGIHKTGNAGDTAMVMVNVYGSPIRRTFVNCFDPERNRIYRLYAPIHRKRILAEAVLKDNRHQGP